MDTDTKQLFKHKKMIICVDDFGFTQGINQAVFKLAEAGKINATSVLVDAEHLTSDDIEKAFLLKNQGKLSLGLHLNFTERLSFAQNEDLIAPINKQLFYSQFPNKTRKLLIYEEIQRQFEKFESLFGFEPEFIDGHQHIHMLPGFFDALKDYYHDNRLDYNDIWIRSLNRIHNLNKSKLPGITNLKNFILRFATKKSSTKFFKLRKELLGVYNFNCSSKEFQDLLKFWIKQSRKYIKETGRGVVIMVHPSTKVEQIKGYLDDDTKYSYDDPISEARVREFEALQSFTIQDY